MTAATLFTERRRRLLASAPADAVLVLPSASMTIRNADVEHDFRQQSDFFYLTGFDEPDAVCVLRNGADPQYVLFVRPKDPERETWTGKRAGVLGAVDLYGADAAFAVGDLDTELPKLIDGALQLGYAWGEDAHRDATIARAARAHRLKPRDPLVGPDITFDPRALLHETRLRKTEPEIADLRRAATITVDGHHEAMRLCTPGIGEYELQAAAEYVFVGSGATRVGYSTIVAGGENATILHYNTNRMRLRDGDLVLIDAGAEHAYYTADVTRTFPVNGRFTPAQRAVYEVVLEAQIAAIEACTVGRPFQDSHDVAVRRLTEGMCALGLLSGGIDELIETAAYKRYYMHRTGHWLGMDVHDVGAYMVERQPRALEAGMVTTVEPGLYIAADDEQAPEPLRGIGVRIEDDILITDSGPDNLTAACVKQVEDVETMMRDTPRWVRRLGA